MTKFTTLMFFLSAAASFVAASPVSVGESTAVTAETGAEVDTTEHPDLDADEFDLAAEEDDEDELELDFDNEEVDQPHNGTLAARACKVGPVNMGVVDTVYAVARSRKVTSKVSAFFSSLAWIAPSYIL